VTPPRQRLPNRRLAETFELEVAGLHYTATIGRFSDGQVAEVFLTNHKAGSQADTNARDSAVVCVETIRKALSRDSHGHASGPLGAALDRLAEEGQ
jgi:hypothetical protein